MMDGGNFGPWHVDDGVRSTNKCLICTARSSGVHYGVVACEGCKAFFRRTFLAKTVYHCYVGEQCHVGPKAKGRCRACRYRRCVAAGMKLDATSRGRTPLRKRIPDTRKFTTCSEDSPGSAGSDGTSPFSQVSSSSGTLSSPGSVVDVNLEPETLLHGKLLQEIVPLRSHTSAPKYEVRDTFRPLTLNKYSKMYMEGSLDNVKKTAADWHSFYSYKHFEKAKESHWKAAMRNTVSIQSTIKSVSSAIHSVYGADIIMWDAAMYDMVVNGNIPYQPQTTLAGFKENSSIGVTGFVRQNCNFCTNLPGFSTFAQGDQRMLLKERWPEGWLITHHRYIRDGKLYHLSGPLKIHGSMYWTQQVMENSDIQKLFHFCNALNKVKLSHLEAYLLYAVSMFAPEATSVQDKPRLALLQAHYRDCLLYVLRSSYSSGTGGREKENRERNILRLADKIRLYNVVGHEYVNMIDFLRDSGGILDG